MVTFWRTRHGQWLHLAVSWTRLRLFAFSTVASRYAQSQYSILKITSKSWRIRCFTLNKSIISIVQKLILCTTSLVARKFRTLLFNNSKRSIQTIFAGINPPGNGLTASSTLLRLCDVKVIILVFSFELFLSSSQSSIEC